jgi:phenylacetate-CoA ligase
MNEVHHHFISTALDALLAEHQDISPEERVLALFQRCVAEVPAYRQFVESHDIKPAEIKSYQALPLMNKANYIQAHCRIPLRISFYGNLKLRIRVSVALFKPLGMA